MNTRELATVLAALRERQARIVQLETTGAKHTIAL